MLQESRATAQEEEARLPPSSRQSEEEREGARRGGEMRERALLPLPSHHCVVTVALSLPSPSKCREAFPVFHALSFLVLFSPEEVNRE